MGLRWTHADVVKQASLLMTAVINAVRRAVLTRTELQAPDCSGMKLLEGIVYRSRAIARLSFTALRRAGDQVFGGLQYK